MCNTSAAPVRMSSSALVKDKVVSVDPCTGKSRYILRQVSANHLGKRNELQHPRTFIEQGI